VKVEGNKIRLTFAHTDGGLKSRDGKPLTGFEIAGADDKFVPAEATIDGDAVVVQAKGVDNPTQVRFGWSNTANPNLVNKEGLPASPFQTKDWKGGWRPCKSRWGATSSRPPCVTRTSARRTYNGPSVRWTPCSAGPPPRAKPVRPPPGCRSHPSLS
jgi:hypothetical protein